MKPLLFLALLFAATLTLSAADVSGIWKVTYAEFSWISPENRRVDDP